MKRYLVEIPSARLAWHREKRAFVPTVSIWGDAHRPEMWFTWVEAKAQIAELLGIGVQGMKEQAYEVV